MKVTCVVKYHVHICRAHQRHFCHKVSLNNILLVTMAQLLIICRVKNALGVSDFYFFAGSKRKRGKDQESMQKKIILLYSFCNNSWEKERRKHDGSKEPKHTVIKPTNLRLHFKVSSSYFQLYHNNIASKMSANVAKEPITGDRQGTQVKSIEASRGWFFPEVKLASWDPEDKKQWKVRHLCAAYRCDDWLFSTLFIYFSSFCLEWWKCNCPSQLASQYPKPVLRIWSLACVVCDY